MELGLQERLKTFTLVGMSGAGKTALSQRLSNDGFFHYSVDYEIAHTYLKNKIKDSVINSIRKQSSLFTELTNKFAIKLDLSLSFDDLEIITMFVIPQNEKGTINFGQFLYNQNLYREAERLATQIFYKRAKIAFENYHITGFIHDTTGSICEIALDDESLIQNITAYSTVLYLKTGESHRKILLERSRKIIKPILYNKNFLLKHMQQYYNKDKFDDSFEIDPEFFIDLFPKLLEFREKSYIEFIKKVNGKEIDVKLFSQVRDAKDFFALIEHQVKSN